MDWGSVLEADQWVVKSRRMQLPPNLLIGESASRIHECIQWAKWKLWESIHRCWYRNLSEEYKNVLSWILKLHPKNSEFLLSILESQTKFTDNSSLLHVLEIIIESHFLYTLEDLYYLTSNSGLKFYQIPLSLKFFAQEKLHMLWWMNFKGTNGDFNKPFFFTTLVEVKRVIWGENFDLQYFYKFYSLLKEKVFWRIRLKEEFENLAHLFTFWEKNEVWNVINSLASFQGDLNFCFKKFISLNQLRLYVLRVNINEWYGASLDISQFPQDIKLYLYQELKHHNFSMFSLWPRIKKISSLYSKTEDTQTFYELLWFMKNLDLNFSSLENLLDFKYKWDISGKELIEKSYGGLKQFFQGLMSSGIHLQLGVNNIVDCLYYSMSSDMEVLSSLSHFPNDYLIIKNVRPDFSIQQLGTDILGNPNRLLPILFMIKQILTLDLNYNLHTSKICDSLWLKSEIKRLKFQYHASLKLSEKHAISQREILSIPDGFFKWVSESQIETYLDSLKSIWYTFTELIDFFNATHYTLWDIYNIIGFPKYYQVPWNLSRFRKFELSEIILHGINSQTTDSLSLGYYLYNNYDIAAIRYLAKNCRNHIWKNAQAPYENSYEKDNSPKAIIDAILDINPNFDFNKLAEQFWVKNSFLSPSFLEETLDVLRIFSHFDFTKISKTLIRFEAKSNPLWNTSLRSDRGTIFRTIISSGAPLSYEEINKKLLLLQLQPKDSKIWKVEETFSIADLEPFLIWKEIFSYQRDKRKGTSEQMRESIIFQTRNLAKIPSMVEKLLSTYPDITFLELLNNIMIQPEIFTLEQRYEIILRTKKYFDSMQIVNKYVNKYRDPRQLLQTILPIDFAISDIKKWIQCVQEWINLIFYFSDQEDFNRVTKKRPNDPQSGGFKYGLSKIPQLSWTISIVNWQKGIQNDFTNLARIHEQRHVKNHFIFDSSLPHETGKDEIIAYLSHDFNFNQIVERLTAQWGLYDYFHLQMFYDIEGYMKNWREHIRLVKKYVYQAFLIKSIFPQDYEDILAVTGVENWDSLIKAYIPAHKFSKRKNINSKSLELFRNNDNYPTFSQDKLTHQVLSNITIFNHTMRNSKGVVEEAQLDKESIPPLTNLVTDIKKVLNWLFQWSIYCDARVKDYLIDYLYQNLEYYESLLDDINFKF